MHSISIGNWFKLPVFKKITNKTQKDGESEKTGRALGKRKRKMQGGTDASKKEPRHDTPSQLIKHN